MHMHILLSTRLMCGLFRLEQNQEFSLVEPLEQPTRTLYGEQPTKLQELALARREYRELAVAYVLRMCMHVHQDVGHRTFTPAADREQTQQVLRSVLTPERVSNVSNHGFCSYSFSNSRGLGVGLGLRSAGNEGWPSRGMRRLCGQVEADLSSCNLRPVTPFIR